MKLTVQQVAEIIGGQVHGNASLPFARIFTDSRLSASPTDTFLALTGQRFDGHAFIPELINNGVQQFIVSEPVKHENSTFIVVPDTKKALQQFAKWHRAQFTIPVIGITGSNGKTIIKEWLSQLLSQDKSVVKSPKSYNSQIGVPLSVLQMQTYHDVGIFEAGISEKGEMDKLEAIIKPTIGILTNIGAAHDEGFTSREEKLREKCILFSDSEVIIARKGLLPASDKLFEWEFLDGNRFHCRVFSFEFEPPFTNEAYLENLGHCLAAMAYLGYSPDTIKTRIAHLQSLAMRLEVKPGKGNSIVVNDSYNADFNALEIALEHGRMQHSSYPLTLVVSDIPQTGMSAEAMTKAIEELASRKGVNKLITIGPATQAYRSANAFASTADFLAQLDVQAFAEQIVVLKGARAFEFERISRQLEEKLHETVWEINLSALINNLNVYRSRLAPGVKTMAMVKALAYGAGDKEIARVLQHQNVDYLGVAFVEEGVALRQAGITLPILVLNVAVEAFEQLVEHNLEPETYSVQHLQRLIAFLASKNISDYPVHLKLDTGMHRLGFAEADRSALLELLASPQIKVVGVMSHLAASETAAEEAFSRAQIATFKEMAQAISNQLGYMPIRHLLNSAGITNYPQAQFEMVRLGIGLYGIDSSGKWTNQLEQIGTLKSHISQVKQLQPGDSVGYGRAFKASQPTTTATIPIGYADGYDRRFSQGVGQVLINGKKAVVIGNVCMDMLMVDVTHLQDVKAGDEVIITSPKHPLALLAKQIGVIPYELLTNISPRIKRLFVYE